jgi:predicted tellurium resistance membrane protein TerC
MSLAENSYRKYAARTAALVAAALAFAAALSLIKGTESGIEFVSGYVLELCLSIDNLIVFILLFESFQIPKKQQEYVLNYGIIGAVLLRGIFILLGSVAVENFKQILALFAAVLLYSSYKVLFQGESDGDKEVKDCLSDR